VRSGEIGSDLGWMRRTPALGDRTVRRSEREITDRATIDSIIRSCPAGRLGLSDDGEPYVVPLCFGYDGDALYFHCAKEGRKIDIIRRNNRVCFEFDVVTGVEEADEACRWGIGYRSVIGVGTAHIVEDAGSKRTGLEALMRQYSDTAYTFPDDAVDSVCIVRIDIESMTGKQS
jgi:uncharacterized protein